MLTLDDLAAAKSFSSEQLAAFGIRQGSRGVEIPYYDATGAETARYRIRSAIAAKDGSAWSEGSAELIPYGLNRPVPWTTYAFICEGESDCWALWTAGKPALGVPGATNSKCLRLEHVAGATSLYVVREPGTAGARFPHKVASTLYSQGFTGTIFAIDLEAKDPHELWAKDPAAFEAGLRAALQSREPLKRPPEPVKIESGVRSLAEVLAKPRKKVEYLIEGILPVGGIMLAVGKPKAGKSELIRNLARSVALGVPFLNRDVQQGHVLWVRLEEPFAHFVDNLVAMGAAEFADKISVNEDAPPEDLMAWIDRCVTEFSPSLIVIDTWAKMTRVDDVSNYSKVNIANEALMRISRERGIAQVWIHHSKKGEGKGGDAVLGSSALFAACDTLLTVDRLPNDVRTVSTTQRMGEDLEDTPIVMDPETKIIEISLVKAGLKNGQTEQQVLELISNEPGISKPDIVERAQARKSDVLVALASLEERGVIARDSKGVKGDPHRYWVEVRNRKSENQNTILESGNGKGLNGNVIPGPWNRTPENRNEDNPRGEPLLISVPASSPRTHDGIPLSSNLVSSNSVSNNTIPDNSVTADGNGIPTDQLLASPIPKPITADEHGSEYGGDTGSDDGGRARPSHRMARGGAA